MNKNEYINFHKKSCDKMIEITRKKNADYTGASDDPFHNFRQIEGIIGGVSNVAEIGFLTRMSDKMSRIGSYVAKGRLEVVDESVDDTLLDLANYCILMLGFITEKRHGVGTQLTLNEGVNNGKES